MPKTKILKNKNNVKAVIDVCCNFDILNIIPLNIET